MRTLSTLDNVTPATDTSILGIIADMTPVQTNKNKKIIDASPNNYTTRPSVETADNRFNDLPQSVRDAITGKAGNNVETAQFDAVHTSKSGKVRSIVGAIMISGEGKNWRPSAAGTFQTFRVGVKADNEYTRLLDIMAATQGGCVVGVPVYADYNDHGIGKVNPSKVVNGLFSATRGLARADFQRFDNDMQCVGTGDMAPGSIAAYVLVRFFGFNHKAPKA